MHIIIKNYNPTDAWMMHLYHVIPYLQFKIMFSNYLKLFIGDFTCEISSANQYYVFIKR